MPQGYLKQRGTPVKIKIFTQKEKEEILAKLDSVYTTNYGPEKDQVVGDAREGQTETLLPKRLSTIEKYGHRPLGAIVQSLKND